jgi:hypothetical protein
MARTCGKAKRDGELRRHCADFGEPLHCVQSENGAAAPSEHSARKIVLQIPEG